MEKEKKKKYKLLPNEFHRHHRWSRKLVTRDKTKYKRKQKHKRRYLDE